jgi:ribonuclease-3
MNSENNLENLKNLEQRLGYRFKDKSLLEDALTHSSYSCGRRSNERLEFLGDSVLQLIVSRKLFLDLPQDLQEGQLSKIRAGLVCEEALSGFAQGIKLGGALFMGKGEEQNGGRCRASILSDAFEAVLAAMYLDGGYAVAERFMLTLLPDAKTLIGRKNQPFDYKTTLQEIIQQNPEEAVTYALAEETGEAHNRIFKAHVLLNGQIIGTGEGTSKKRAEQNAAKQAVELMGIEL